MNRDFEWKGSHRPIHEPASKYSKLKKEIKALLREQKIIIPRLNAMDKKLCKLETDITSYIKKAWKKTKQKAELKILNLQCGSHSTNFKIEVFIEVLGYAISGRNKWSKIKYDFDSDDFAKSYVLADPPTSMKFLKEFAKQMSDELGIRVEETQEHIPTQKQIKKRVEKYGFIDFEGASALYDGDLEFLRNGKVWYKGWDIPDSFLICRRYSNSKLFIAYSTDGHSGEFNIILDGPTKKELSVFFDFIELEDSDNVGLREKYNSAGK